MQPRRLLRRPVGSLSLDISRARHDLRQRGATGAGLFRSGSPSLVAMAEGTGAARAPFECVCGFTAGTSFAWEKHLALRNTPYSSVKHSRVIRAGGDVSHANKSYETETPLRLSRVENERYDSADYENSGSNVPYPTPKALFRDRGPSAYAASPTSASKPIQSSYARPASPSSSRSVINGIRLQEAAKRGDMDRVARLAVEILRLAQQGDPDGVLDVISDRSSSPTPSRDAGLPARKSPAREIKFSANITAVHQAPSGIAIEQVSSRIC